MYGIARNAVFQALRTSRAKMVGRPKSFQKISQEQSRNACGFSTTCREITPVSTGGCMVAFFTMLFSCYIPWGYYLVMVPEYQKRDDGPVEDLD